MRIKESVHVKGGKEGRWEVGKERSCENNEIISYAHGVMKIFILSQGKVKA